MWLFETGRTEFKRAGTVGFFVIIYAGVFFQHAKVLSIADT